MYCGYGDKVQYRLMGQSGGFPLLSSAISHLPHNPHVQKDRKQAADHNNFSIICTNSVDSAP